MSQDTISFRIDRKKKAKLDSLAKALDRDRSHLLNQAVADFLEAHDRDIALIEEGIAAADRGDYATPAQVAGARRKWLKSARHSDK
jgi:predicted transcriptional regulator